MPPKPPLPIPPKGPAPKGCCGCGCLTFMLSIMLGATGLLVGCKKIYKGKNPQ